MDDATAIMAIFIFTTIGVTGALVVGRLLDPYFRASMMRRLTKKDYGVLHVVSKDARNIRHYVADFNQDVLNVNGNVWIIRGYQVYREDKPERGFFINFGQDPKASNTPIKWGEGVPGIFVDNESLKPRDFEKYREEGEQKVKPDEVANFITAYIFNQLAKAMAGVRNQQLILLVVGGLVVVSIIVGYTNFDTNSRIETKLNGIEAHLTAQDDRINSIPLLNNTLVYEAPKNG